MTRIRLAYYVALFTSIATYLLILVGGLVHNTGSSMACPDWPLCFGEALPKLEGGILYEHGHRYLASFVGFCTIMLVVLLWPFNANLRQPGKSKWLALGTMFLLILLAIPAIIFSDGYRDRFEQGGLAARLAEMNLAPLIVITLSGMLILALTCFAKGLSRGETPLSMRAIGLLVLILLQGMLGGTTVAYNLPDLVSTAHLGTSMMVLLSVIFIAYRSHEQAMAERDIAPRPAMVPAISRVVLAMTVATFLQVLLGALVRHTQSSSAAGVGQYFLVGLDNGEPSMWPSSGAGRLNMLHRYSAFVVLGVLVAGGGWAWLRAAKDQVRGAWMLWLPPFVAIAQVLIGMGMLAMDLPNGMRLAHLAGGAALMAMLGILLVWSMPMRNGAKAATASKSRSGTAQRTVPAAASN